MLGPIKQLRKLWMVIFIGIIYVGCAPVDFAVDMGSDGCDAFGGPGTCRYENGRLVGKPRAFTMNGGKIDIVFVNDNSGSMSFYQKKLGARLKSFIDHLNKVKSDFQVGIVTTDISTGIDASFQNNDPRAINGNGAFQDGKLIAFPNGKSFFSVSDFNTSDFIAGSIPGIDLFKRTIERDETQKCDVFLKTGTNKELEWESPLYRENCPSGDERGLYAASLVLKNNPSGIIRDESNKVVFIILGNEDVRSSAYSRTKFAAEANFRLKPEDMPTSLVDVFRQKYPRKSLKVNTISILPGPLKKGIGPLDASNRIYESFRFGGTMNAANSPDQLFEEGDSKCLNPTSGAEAEQAGFARTYSYLYSLAARITGGVETSLCQEDYGRKLEEIAENAVRNEFFVCNDLQIDRAWIGNIGASESQMGAGENKSVNVTAENGYAKFPNDLPPGTAVNLDFTCAVNK